MSTSSKTAVVGRRLRRTLGALLAAGFGVTWWGLVPPARADAPKMGPCLNPASHTLARRVDVKHTPTRRLVTLTIAKRIPPRIVKRPPLRPLDVTPVSDPVRSPFAQPPPGWTGGIDRQPHTPVATPVAQPPRVRPLPPKPPVVDPLPPKTPVIDPLVDPIPVATPVQPPVIDPIPVPDPTPVIDLEPYRLPPTRSS